MSEDRVFEPEPFIYVEAVSSERARMFFGAPIDWPCYWDGIGKRGISVWKLPTEGLTIRSIQV
jgi:hypothetical protein